MKDLSKEVRETEKAFGGCKNCYGKGYSTSKTYSEGYEDFGGEGFRKEQSPYLPCTKCDRGTQIQDLISRVRAATLQEAIEEAKAVLQGYSDLVPQTTGKELDRLILRREGAAQTLTRLSALKLEV